MPSLSGVGFWSGLLAGATFLGAVAVSVVEARSTVHGAQTCSFEFPEPAARFAGEGVPSLLEFPVFSADEYLDIQGAQRSGFQLLVFSAHAFDQDGQLNTAATIGYIQTMRGLAVLFDPDEVASEFERLDQNARVMFEAETRRELIEIDGLAVQAHISTADASMIATLMLPINNGEFFHPVSIGVYPGMAGCDATMEETFQYVLGNLTLRLENPDYHNAPRIRDAMEEKREAR